MVSLIIAWRSYNDRRFGQQEIDQKGLADACCKKVLVPTRDEDVVPMWIQALKLSQTIDGCRFEDRGFSASKGTSRQIVANTLMSHGCEPIWHDLFGTSGEDIRPMLHKKIDN